MADHSRSRSEEPKEERQRGRTSRCEEAELVRAPGVEVVLPGATVDDLVALLTDPRIDHPANVPMRARAAAELQQRYGNAYLQRSIAHRGDGQDAGARLDAVREPTRGRRADAAAMRAQGTRLRVTELAGGVRLSLTLDARLEDGEPGGTAAGSEEETERLETLEPIQVPANILVGGEDAITGSMGLTHTTQQGGAELGGAFGICQPIVRTILIGATPRPQLLGLLGTNYDVRVSADIEYHWDVQPLGRTHVSGADDPAVTEESWSQVVHDLAPSSAVPCRSPRREHWARDLTSRHELFHRDDFVAAFTIFTPVSQIWLNTQTASSVQSAIDKGEDALGMLITNVNNYMGSGDSAPAEVRAYEDGRAPYQERADAVRAKAGREDWEEGLVVLS